jgi:hypothetical protein
MVGDVVSLDASNQFALDPLRKDLRQQKLCQNPDK